MVNLAEAHRALYGASLLAKFDADGLNAFGHEREDAARSFFAAIIVAPMYIVWAILYGQPHPEGTPFLSVFVFESLSYAIGWMIFPLAVWHLSPALGCRTRFFHFLAAYNWAAVIQNGIFMGMDLTFWLTGAPEGARGFFGLALLVYVLLYGWFVAKHGLGLATGPAATIVALDLIIAMFWELISDGMIIAP
jgi:hypothetical protein